MDTAWIQVFVLTLAECVAPAGKSICQEREFDLQFLTRADCEYALEQLVSLKDESASVIVNRRKSRCAASARKKDVFDSLDAVSVASQGMQDWQEPDAAEATTAPTRVLHQSRLENLPNCSESDGESPCKMGGIIIEAVAKGKSVEVWRRDP